MISVSLWVLPLSLQLQTHLYIVTRETLLSCILNILLFTSVLLSWKMLFIVVWNNSPVDRLSHNLVTLMWTATFRPLYCWSSSGNSVEWLCISISGTWVAFDGCISILIVLIRLCSLRGRLWYRSAVVLFDRGDPRFRNFNYVHVIPIDVVRVKSYVNGFLNPTGVPVWSRSITLTLSQTG